MNSAPLDPVNMAVCGVAGTSVLVVLVQWADPWLVRHRPTRRALPVALGLYGVACALLTIAVWRWWTALFLALYAGGYAITVRLGWPEVHPPTSEPTNDGAAADAGDASDRPIG